MANGIRTGDLRRFNKGRSLKFRVGSRVRRTPEEGQRIYRPKRCGNDIKDEDDSPKTFNDKNLRDLFENYSYSIGKCAKKKFFRKLPKKLKYERTITAIT